MKKAVNTPVKPKSKRVMVLYGLDEHEKPRAAVFGEPNFKLARKAAGLMNLTVHVGLAPDLAHALKGIRPGRIYGTGAGFVPNIKPKRYEELLQALQPKEKATEAKDGLPVRLPRSRDDIEVGHQMSAQADDPSLGWWETTVEAVEGQMLSLRAVDFPEVSVSRHRHAVALGFTPEYMPPSDLGEAAPGLPTDWASLREGHLVLAHDGPGEGWWDALVVEAREQDVVVRWRDYPKPAKLIRPVRQIALLCPTPPESR